MINQSCIQTSLLRMDMLKIQKEIEERMEGRFGVYQEGNGRANT
jgi:hypothetical protein